MTLGKLLALHKPVCIPVSRWNCVTQGKIRITRKSCSEEPILMVLQKPDISNQITGSFQRIFASENTLTERYTVE